MMLWWRKITLMVILSIGLVFPNMAFAAKWGCDATETFDSVESRLPDGWIAGTQQSENIAYASSNEFIEWSINENTNYCDSRNFASDGRSLCVSSDNALATGRPAIGYKAYVNSPVFDTSGVSEMTIQFDLNYQSFNNSDRLEFKLRSNEKGEYRWHVLEAYSEDVGGWFEPNTGIRQTIVITNSELLGDPDTRIGWMYLDQSGDEADWYAQIDNVSITCQEVDVTAVSVASIDTGTTQITTTLILSMISVIVVLSGFYAVRYSRIST